MGFFWHCKNKTKYHHVIINIIVESGHVLFVASTVVADLVACDNCLLIVKTDNDTLGYSFSIYGVTAMGGGIYCVTVRPFFGGSYV